MLNCRSMMGAVTCARYELPARACWLLPAEDFAIHRVQVTERADAVARKTRAVHDGERFRFQVSKLFEILRGKRRVRNVLRQNARLEGLHRFIRAAHDIFGRNRLDVTVLMEKVRAEQGFLGFLKKHACVPAVWQMGSVAIAVAELARR